MPSSLLCGSTWHSQATSFALLPIAHLPKADLLTLDLLVFAFGQPLLVMSLAPTSDPCIFMSLGNGDRCWAGWVAFKSGPPKAPAPWPSLSHKSTIARGRVRLHHERQGGSAGDGPGTSSQKEAPGLQRLPSHVPKLWMLQSDQFNRNYQ